MHFSYRLLTLIALLPILHFTTSTPAAAGAGGELTILVDRTDDLGFVAACDDATPDDCTLRGAITLANAQPLAIDVTVELPAGTFELTTNGASEDSNATGDLDILRDMTIRGQGRDATFISGGEFMPLDDRMLEIHGPDHFVVIESLALVHGDPGNGLHSIFVASTNIVRFEDCAIRHHGNTVLGSGALRLSYGVEVAVVENCTFEDNEAFAPGAAISSAADVLSIRTSQFLRNESIDAGGALQLEPPIGGTVGQTFITESRFEDNQAPNGGAIWADQETSLELSGATFRGNQAVDPAGDGVGGAIYSNADVVAEGSTFFDNRSEDDGAAIASVMLAPPQPVVDLFNTTFSANLGLGVDVAAVQLIGSEVEYLHVTSVGQPLDLATDQAQVSFQNTVFEGGCDFHLNTSTSNGGSLAPDDSCWGLSPDPTDQLIAGGLELGALAPNGGPTWTHVPGPTSPLLGASPVCPPSDQRQMPRPGVDCTTGAVERQPNEGEIFLDGFESGDLTGWSSVVN